MPCGAGDQTPTPEKTEQILAGDNQYLEMRAVSVKQTGDRKITSTYGTMGSQLRICTDLTYVFGMIILRLISLK